MKIITNVIVGIFTALFTAALVLFFVNRQLSPMNREYALKDLMNTKAVTEKNIDDIAASLLSRLKGFCSTVANDRDFAMKLIVEKDYSAPEVADITATHINAMGFSFLEIANTDYRILSSGHFPASAGNCWVYKNNLPDSSANFMFDNIKGTDVLSLQVKIPFSCAGGLFYCIGGIVVDSNFINRIKSRPDISIILKQGNEILGMEGIETMSDIKDNEIIINDKSWFAQSLTLTWAGAADSPEIIVLLEKPPNFHLLDVF